MGRPESMPLLRLTLLAGALCAATWPGPAAAQTPESERVAQTPESERVRPVFARPLTQVSFELGLSWLGLPLADVCSRGRCTGDSSPMVELWGLARLRERWAFGAGGSWGFWPTATSEGTGDDQRVHTRSYLLLEAVGRYYPVLRRRFDAWLGPGGGLVILSDRFMAEPLEHNRYLRVGDPGAQLRTEGLSLFFGGGLNQALTRYSRFGLGARVGGLFFPKGTASTTLLERASISGTTLTITAGLTFTVTTDR